MSKETPDNFHSTGVDQPGGIIGSAEGTRKTLLKQMIPNARDCTIEWKADFAKMTITMRANIISPQLLKIFLATLPGKDERFQKTGITNVIHICRRFKVQLRIDHGANEASYLVSAYLDDGPGGSLGVEIELVPEG